MWCSSRLNSRAFAFFVFMSMIYATSLVFRILFFLLTIQSYSFPTIMLIFLKGPWMRSFWNQKHGARLINYYDILAGGLGWRPWKSRQEGGRTQRSLLQGSFQPIVAQFERLVRWHFKLRPWNSRNILLTYFSPDINDNVSSFAGRVWNAWDVFTRTQTQPTTLK